MHGWAITVAVINSYRFCAWEYISCLWETWKWIYIYIYIYIYIKWTVFVNVTTKSAQHAHARMIAIIVEKSPNSSHMYDHGFMDNTNRQAVKNWLDSQTRIKSVFDCLTIGIIHETMVVHMTWVWTFFNNYIYIYIYIYICLCLCDVI